MAKLELTQERIVTQHTNVKLKIKTQLKGFAKFLNKIGLFSGQNIEVDVDFHNKEIVISSHSDIDFTIEKEVFDK